MAAQRCHRSECETWSLLAWIEQKKTATLVGEEKKSIDIGITSRRRSQNSEEVKGVVVFTQC